MGQFAILSPSRFLSMFSSFSPPSPLSLSLSVSVSCPLVVSKLSYGLVARTLTSLTTASMLLLDITVGSLCYPDPLDPILRNILFIPINGESRRPIIILVHEFPI